MIRERIFETLKHHVFEVEPELEGTSLEPGDSLRALGVPSVSRVEILMLTMESLGISVPNTELTKAQNLGDLVSLFERRLSAQDRG